MLARMSTTNRLVDILSYVTYDTMNLCIQNSPFLGFVNLFCHCPYYYLKS